MDGVSRRTFLKSASASVVGALVWSSAPRVMANPLGLPIGLQLYSVRELLPKDYEATLRQIAALGYQEVEAAGFFNHSASDVKQAMEGAGLHCVSAHYGLKDLLTGSDEILAYGRNLGLQFIVCASPLPRNWASVKDPGSRQSRDAMTIDDWRWNAEQFNRIGERVSAAGMRFAYHNHTPEFRSQNGVVFYDELLRSTDPAKISMELDCGWAEVAGKNPADYLARYPTRFSMLHVKDFNLKGFVPGTEPPPSTELGRGSIDYRAIFLAAKKCKIEHAFVEQEQFDLPPMEALKLDAEYMRHLTV